MKISIIAAMTKRGVIGKGNELPWNIPEEMKHFSQTTRGCTVIMGKRTYDSIGRPLPKRHNIVLAQSGTEIAGVDVCHSKEQAFEKARLYGKDIFIIGGAYTYAQFLSVADRLYISYIKQDYDGDVFFPAFDWSGWKATERKDHSDFEFVLYEPNI